MSRCGDLLKTFEAPREERDRGKNQGPPRTPDWLASIAVRLLNCAKRAGVK